MASRFMYHAYAVGLAGQFTRPISQVIPSQAASALAPGGGYSSARHEPHQFHEIFSHQGVASKVSGTLNPKTGNHETSVTATVSGLNIDHVLHLDSCTAHLRSVHPPKGQPHITPHGSFFENLRIAGREIKLESRVEDYHRLDTFEKLSEHYKTDSQFQARYLKDAFVGNEKALHEKQHPFFPWRNIKDTAELPVTKAQGQAIVPLFVVTNSSAPGFHVSGNVITVEDFGTIVLGEMIISGYERRITMLRVELGSPTEGSMCVGIGNSNGGTTDPD
jgi:hypothetical protein